MTLGKSGFLGWTTWLTSKPVAKDVDDPIFDPEAS
jgi:predicted component of type VI protein secretion system